MADIMVTVITFSTGAKNIITTENINNDPVSMIKYFFFILLHAYLSEIYVP